MPNDKRRRQPKFEVQPVPLNQLYVSDNNVRQRDITVDLDELSRSLDTIGLQQPIVVQRRGINRYAVLIGQRRYLAAKELGWPSIPARILGNGLNDRDAKVLSFSENVQRRDLSPRDKADACEYLVDQLRSVRAVAKRLGVTEQTVRKWLHFAAVPERLKAMVEKNEITRDVATRIAQSVPDERQALRIARRIAEISPPKAERDRILDAVEQYPDRPMEVILRRAREARVRKEITFILPERYASALDRAANEMAMDANDVARDATIDWLRSRYFF